MKYTNVSSRGLVQSSVDAGTFKLVTDGIELTASGPLLDEAGRPWRILDDCWCANCKEARKRLEALG